MIINNIKRVRTTNESAPSMIRGAMQCNYVVQVGARCTWIGSLAKESDHSAS
eukprot:m.251944 g.251944  ORF g.251944 m.251944 type:complete len:52 (-) comp15464_c0_seq1:60-215(-)